MRLEGQMQMHKGWVIWNPSKKSRQENFPTKKQIKGLYLFVERETP